MKSTTGRMERATCDACGRKDQRCEVIVRGEYTLRLCVDWRSCNAAQPSLDEMAGKGS